MYCPKCGAENTEGSAFCRSCGSSLGPALAPMPVQQPAVTQQPAAPEKSPLLAAFLNFLFGLGYVYLGYRRILGLNPFGFVMIMILAYFFLGIFSFGLLSLVLAILLSVDGYQKGAGKKGFISAQM